MLKMQLEHTAVNRNSLPLPKKGSANPVTGFNINVVYNENEVELLRSVMT